MRNYKNYADMITFSRASSGTALAKISYGSEMVTNGTFDTDFSGWTVIGQQPTVVNSQLRLTTNSANVGVNQDIGLQAGKMYLASYDIISITGGAMRLALGSAANGTNRTAPGSYSELLYVSGDTVARLYQVTSFSSEVIVVDNVSVKEVLYDQPDGTLQLFNHPSNQPRVEYDYQGNRLGLLVEEARTNYVIRSENFSHGSWVKSYSTVVAGYDGPDNTNAAYKFIPSSGGTTQTRLFISTGAGSNQDVTSSIYAKAGELNTILLSGWTGALYKAIHVNLETGELLGSINSPDDYSITKVTDDGWYRITITVSGTTGNFLNVSAGLVGDSFNSSSVENSSGWNDVNGIYIYGAQAEVGSFPTSYIPTAGSTVTRAADVASIDVGAFGYNKTAGTTVVKGVSFGSGKFQYFYSFHDNSGSYNNSSLLFLNTSGVPAYQRLSAGAYVVNTTQSIAYTPGQVTKFAVAETVDDMSFVQDAGDPKVDTAGALPSGIEKMNIASNPLNGQTLNGHISSIAYYPRRLTNAQIQKLTSVSTNSTLSLTFDGTSDSYLETNIHG